MCAVFCFVRFQVFRREFLCFFVCKANKNASGASKQKLGSNLLRYKSSQDKDIKTAKKMAKEY